MIDGMEIGQQALISISSHLVFIGFTFWALQALHFDKLLSAGRVFQARVLYIFLTIAIGSSVSNFFLDYLHWSRQLQYFFK
ncbi:DUF1146 family protein [Siminovitchia fortis]|uniref:DUF1146 family protein n=1 Tax=Siminovitchia fortis TaxID=254758 RepID=UPI0011A2DCAC|nr:DUF1146 family protein [Siminovitchia fortis]